MRRSPSHDELVHAEDSALACSEWWVLMNSLGSRKWIKPLTDENQETYLKMKRSPNIKTPMYAFSDNFIFKLYQSNLIRHVFSQLPWKRWYSEQIWAQMTLLRTWFVFRTFFCSPKELYSEPQHLNWGGCPDLWSSSHSSNCTCLFLSWIFFYPQMGMALHGPNFHQTRYYRFHEFEHTLEKKKISSFQAKCLPSDRKASGKENKQK